MIKSSIIVVDGKTLKRTFSDAGFMIKQVETGNIFSEAVDPLDSKFTYRETNRLITSKFGNRK